MTESSLIYLEYSFKLFAALSGVASAFFYFMEKKRGSHINIYRKWLRTKWLKIRNNKTLHLPEITIAWFCKKKEFLILVAYQAIEKKKLLRFAFHQMILGTIAFAFYLNKFPYAIIIMIYYFAWIVIWNKILKTKEKKSGLLYTIVLALLVALPFICLFSIYIIVKGALTTSLETATLLFLFFSPVYLIAIGIPLVYYLGIYKLAQVIKSGDEESFTAFVEDKERFIKVAINKMAHLQSFSLGICLSFLVTILALFLGHIISPSSWIPQTMQMFISNLLFDGLTMVITFWILGWALKGNTTLKLLPTVLLDVIACAILAVLSLFLGLYGSENELAIYKVLKILIGFSPTGQGLEFGPYFWAMHTTFIPTLIYLGVLILVWIGKIVVTPYYWFLDVNIVSKKPFELTSALFAFLAALTLLIGILFEGIKHIA